MSTGYDRLADLWKILNPLFEKMLSMNGLTKTEHAQVCNCVYGYCISVDTTVSISDNSKVIGFELYKRLRQFFKNHKAIALNGSELLSFFEKYWVNYSLAAKYIDHRCNYLNRNWVKTKVDEGSKDIVIVYSLALVIWKEELFKPCSRAFISAILDEVEKERKGECVSTSRLCTVINSLVELCITSESHPTASLNTSVPPVTPRGHDNVPSTQVPSYCPSDAHLEWRQGLPVYRDHFEQPFLRETVRYYETESSVYLSRHSVTDYLKWAEVCVENEKRRADSYLHKTTLHELIKTTYDCLIGNHIETIAAEFTNLLKDNRIEDLARMYKALIRFEEGESRLVQMLEAYVDEVGSDALKQVCETAKTAPKVFVDTIIEVQLKCDNLLQNAFSKNASFSRAIDKGCERFINRNAITEALGSTRKTPELVAKYADILLRKGARDAQNVDLDEAFGHVMKVFKFVEDKDIFQKFYSNMLARRLVHNQSISEDAEGAMITLLRNSCGLEYTSKLQRMFQDVTSSRDLNACFNEWLKAKKEERRDQPDNLSNMADFTIMVLSSNAWPFQAQSQLNLPYELEKCLKVFTEFYQGHHEGRKLSWCYQLCRGEVVSLYTKMRYTFAVSTYQMAILMLFNNANCYSLRQIRELTNLEENMLNQILSIFLKARILMVTAGDASEEQLRQQQVEESALVNASDAPPILTPDVLLTLFFNYNNKRIRVNLNMPVKSEVKQETETTLANVECDRKLSIQACIVRIMKTRKRLDHQQLVREVVDQMASRFNPPVSQIKLCINSLIERDFIKRDPNNLNIYEYIA
nr:cullin 1 [Hymenolepis microstoma]